MLPLGLSGFCPATLSKRASEGGTMDNTTLKRYYTLWSKPSTIRVRHTRLRATIKVSEANRSNCGLSNSACCTGGQTNSAGCMSRVRGRGDPGPVRIGSDRAIRRYPRSTSESCKGQPGKHGDTIYIVTMKLGKRGNHVEFENTCTQMRVTCFDSTVQTFGFQGAAVISTRGW